MLRLIKSAGTLAVGQSVALLVPVLTIPYMSSALDIETFAIAMALMSILQFGYIVCEFGSNILGPEYLASHASKKTLSEVGTAIFLGRLIVLLIYLCLAFFLFDEARLNFLSFLIVSTSLLLYTVQPIWYYTALEKFSSLTFVMLVGKFVNLIYVFPALYIYPTLESALLAATLGNLTTLGLMLLSGNGVSIFSYKDASFLLILNYLNAGFKILLSQTFLNFHFYLGVPIIMQWAGGYQAASYAAAETVAKAIRGGMGTASQAALPHFLKKRDVAGYLKFFFLVLVSSIALTMIVFFKAEDIHLILFDQKFEGFEAMIGVFAILIPISVGNQLFGYPAFAMLDCRHVVENTSVILPLITFGCLALSYLIQGEFSVLSWIWSIIAAELFMFAVKIFFFRSALRK